MEKHEAQNGLIFITEDTFMHGQQKFTINLLGVQGIKA